MNKQTLLQTLLISSVLAEYENQQYISRKNRKKRIKNKHKKRRRK